VVKEKTFWGGDQGPNFDPKMALNITATSSVFPRYKLKYTCILLRKAE
jgi:hypothetical protein